MLLVTLPAARDESGRLPVARGVPGGHAGARSVARTDVVVNSFFLEISCARLRACESLMDTATAARRMIPATDAAGGASSGPRDRVNPWLTGRWILEVAPYGYNLYPNPHESTAFPHATGADPLAVCDRPRSRPHRFMERNGQHRRPFRDGWFCMGQRRGEWRKSYRGCPSGASHAIPTAGYRRPRA